MKEVLSVGRAGTLMDWEGHVVNLDHYRLDADYKHGIHFTALPTAWVTGFDKTSSLRIGSSTAWVTETPGATAGFLEFTGQGLTTFERALDRDERLISVLGSRLLEGQKKVGETAQAIELRQSGENSILGNLAFNVSASLTQVLRWAHWWNSTEDSPDNVTHERVLVESRACLKIAWGPAAGDFGCGQDGEARASPERAVRAEPTPAADKRPAAQRVFAEQAGWLCCSSVGDRCGFRPVRLAPPSARLVFQPFPQKQDPTEFSVGLFRAISTSNCPPSRASARRSRRG